MIESELCRFTLSMLGVLIQEFVKLDKVVNDVSHYLSNEKIDFGYEFSNFLANKITSNEISYEQAFIVKERCSNFLKKKSLQRNSYSHT